jgi:predicted RND superfamily exporter protein
MYIELYGGKLMKCIKCGKENNDNSKFCNECGSILEEQKCEIENIQHDNVKIIELGITQTDKGKGSSKSTKILKNKKMIVISTLLLFLIGIIIYTSIDSANAKNPDEIFKKFSTDKKEALKEYDNLSKDEKDKVNDRIKKGVETISGLESDENEFEKDISQYRDIKVLDSYFSQIIEKRKKGKEPQEKTSQKAKDEFNKIRDSENAIDMSKMTNEQYVNFINQYMRFLDKYNNDGYDLAIGKLVQLKDKYAVKMCSNVVLFSDVSVKQPKIGMTKDEVVALTKYIKPDHVNKTTTAYGVSEQYVYGNDYLYFDNDGKLTSIQN